MKSIPNLPNAPTFETSAQQSKSSRHPKIPEGYRPTFSSTMKTVLDRRDIEEFHYHREKNMLEYLKLDGRQYREQRKILDEKIDALTNLHSQIEEDKTNLLKKIDQFNPLDIEELKRYLDMTKNYSVELMLLSMTCSRFASMSWPKNLLRTGV